MTFGSIRPAHGVIANCSAITTVIPVRLPAIVSAIALLLSTLAIRAQEATPPNPKDHRPEIRAALLKATPLGSTANQVIDFMRKSLLPAAQRPPPVEEHPAQSEAAGDSAKKGVKSIHYMLGSYMDNPALLTLSAPLLLQREVTVDWAFDKDDRLVEIFVDKRTATY